MHLWENSTFDFCNKVQQVCLYLPCCYKGNIFRKCCSYIIFIYILRNSKSYENVLTPGGMPKADEIGACGALASWKWWKEVFAVLHDSKHLLWQLFSYSAYEKKDKYLIDFTFELVSGGYYIHWEVRRECVKSGVSWSDQEGWNVCNNYICHLPYLRNSIVYDHDFWCTCIKWWYLPAFFSFFI